MTVPVYFRTKELADAVHISVQQVRNYEADGFLPPVERSAKGYRRYTRQHLVALQTARALIGAYGWQKAQQIMGATHQGDFAEALAAIDEYHAELNQRRHQLEETLASLTILTHQLPTESHPRSTQRLRVSAAARLVAVRVSAIRFWEQLGLLKPLRDKDNNYRLYDTRQMRQLRIVALLRQANYDFESIQTTLNELEAGQPRRAIAAVEQRRNEVSHTSWQCLQALARFHAYVEEFLEGISIPLPSTTKKGQEGNP